LIAAVMAGVTWAGASLMVVSDGRRSQALGLALVGAGLGGVVWSEGPQAAGFLLALGAAVAALLHLRRGAAGWLVMPAGSTPRLILAVVGGLIALWIGASGGATDSALRVAIFTVIVLMGARIVQGGSHGVALAAVAALAVAIGSASTEESRGVLIPIVAAIAAGASALVPTPVLDGA
jgi:hypothetical protein